MFDAAKVRGYERPAELLGDARVDVAIVCTPTETHVELAVQALAAGKHVLVEKPVALRSDDVRRLERAADEAWHRRGLRCMPAMCMRFWPGWDWLRDAVVSRRYGPLRSLSIQRLGTMPGWSGEFYADAARSGGVLGDLHVHDTDFVCWALGAGGAWPKEVVTRGTALHSTTLYGFDGVHVSAEAAWDLTRGAGFRMRYLAVFEGATADFDQTRAERLRLCVAGGEPANAEIPAGTGYVPQLRHFLGAVRDGGVELRATVAEAARVTSVLEAERRSLEGGAG